MKSILHISAALLLVLLMAPATQSYSTFAKITIKNYTRYTIAVQLDIDKGSGGGYATIASNGSHTFDTAETAWYAKKVVHKNKLYIRAGGRVIMEMTLSIPNIAGPINETIEGRAVITVDSNPDGCHHVATEQSAPSRQQDIVAQQAVDIDLALTNCMNI